MKKLFAFTLALLLLAALAGCAHKEDVKYYEIRTYTKAQTGDITRGESTYDENWNLLLQYMTLNGNFTSKVEYEYSEDYTVLTATSTSATYGTDVSTTVRTFDEKGQVIRAENYDGDRQISTTEYAYDDKGEMVFARSSQPESDVVITIQRTFDDRGNLVTYIQDTGYYVGRYEYSYNKKNQRIREEYYRDDELLDYVDFVWEGNVGTGTSYNADGTPLGKQVLEYDSHGNLLRLEAQDLSGAPKTILCYEYIGTDGSISSGIPD